MLLKNYMLADRETGAIIADFKKELNALRIEEIMTDYFFKMSEALMRTDFYNTIGSQTLKTINLPRDSEGKYYVKTGISTLEIPANFEKIFVNTARIWQGLSEVTGQLGLDNYFPEYTAHLLEWINHVKARTAEQTSSILDNCDILYENYKARVVNLAKESVEPQYSFIGLIPELFAFTCRLISLQGIKPEFKAELSMALIYLTSPVDFIPENIVHHPIAVTDDLIVMLHVIKKGILTEYLEPDVIARHWRGETGFFLHFDNLILSVEEIFGKNFLSIFSNKHIFED